MIRSTASPPRSLGRVQDGRGFWLGLMLTACSVLPTAGCRKCAHPKPSQPVESAAIELAITVDDLPLRIADGVPGTAQEEEKVFESFLSAFAHHEVPAVYGFVNGKRVEEAPARFPLLEAWRNAGHPLGNHTYSHARPNNAASYIEDIDRGEDVLRRLYPGADERTWKVFRFPYLNEGAGEKRTAIKAHLESRGYRVAPVSVDFFDYAYADAYARCTDSHDAAAVARIESSFVRNAVECLRGSDTATRKAAGRRTKHVLLLHVGPLQAKLLERMLAELRAANVKFISLDQALEDPFLQTHPKPGSESRRLCGRAAVAEVKRLCMPRNENAPDDEHDNH